MDAVRFGVLGTAKIGREQVIPALQEAVGCEVVALASRELDSARNVAGALGIPQAVGSYEDLLADPDIDAVYIPLPNHLHAPWTVAAARAGKHVLCEKPIALDADEARRVVAECADAGVKMMEAFMYRFHPSWVRVRELVDSGAIGDLQAVQSWFSYYLDDPTNIRSIREYGGGALMDIGCYCVNLSRMLFRGEPTAVDAMVRRDRDSGVDIVTSAMLQFGEGQATFTASTRSEDDQRVHISGSAGRIEIEIPFNIPGDRPTRVFHTHGGNPPVAPATETIELAPKNPYTAMGEAFAAAVLDDRPVPLGNEDSIANMTVIDAIAAQG